MWNSPRLPWLAALAIMMIGLSSYAHAGRVTVENNSDHEIHFAFVFYDYQKKDFYIRGWFKVPAGEKVHWNFNIAPDRKFYWYGKNYENTSHWPSQGDHEQAVIYKAMNMKTSVVKTYADAKNVMFATRETDTEGNITIKLRN